MFNLPRQIATNPAAAGLEHALPVFIRDVLQELGKERNFHPPMERHSVIGFCGQAHESLEYGKAVKPLSIAYRNLKFHFNLSYYQPHSLYPPTFLRSKALSILERADLIKTNFIKRTHYRGGAEKD